MLLHAKANLTFAHQSLGVEFGQLLFAGIRASSTSSLLALIGSDRSTMSVYGPRDFMSRLAIYGILPHGASPCTSIKLALIKMYVAHHHASYPLVRHPIDSHRSSGIPMEPFTYAVRIRRYLGATLLRRTWLFISARWTW